MPSPIIIRIQLKPHLKDFLIKTHGHPIIASERSLPGTIIKHLLSKTPGDYKPDSEPDDLVMLLPFYADKDPRIYNYLSPESMKVFQKMIENVFWTTYINFIEQNYQPKSKRESLKKQGIKDSTEKFILNNGINPDHITIDAFIKRYRRGKNPLKKQEKSFEVLSFKNAQHSNDKTRRRKKGDEIHFRIDHKKKKKLKKYCQENNISMVDFFNDSINQLFAD